MRFAHFFKLFMMLFSQNLLVKKIAFRALENLEVDHIMIELLLSGMSLKVSTITTI